MIKKVLKNFYKGIPFKQQFFCFLKKVWKPKEPIYKHLYFKGVFHVPVADNKGFKIMHYGFQLENEVFWSGLQGGWEKYSVGLWIKLCENAKVVFDIGANTGIYSLIAKAMSKDATVFAFEPVKRVYEKLVSNNSLNGYNIHCIADAVSNSNGVARFYDTPAEHTYSVTINQNLNAKGIPVIETEVQTIMLDTFIEQGNISRIDILKIDVETHEPEVLEGFKVYLPKFRPAILIEVLNDDVAHKVEDAVKGLNYLYFNIDEKNGIRRTEHIGKSDYYNYLLCTEETAKQIGILN